MLAGFSNVHETFKFTTDINEPLGSWDSSQETQVLNLLNSLPGTLLKGEIKLNQIRELLLILLTALESDEKYSDGVIVQMLKCNSFLVVYFTLAVIDTRNSAHIDLACKCLAMAGNMYHTLWQEFLNSEFTTRLVLSVTLRGLDRCEELVEKSKTTMSKARKSTSETQYLGYDSRDKADYNIEGYDYNDAILEEAIAEKTEMELTIQTWLHLLFQFYCHQINEVNRLVRMERTDASSSVENRRTSWNSNGQVTVIYCGLVERILLLSQSLPEEAFVQVIKIAAAMNFQLPVRLDSNSTEVAVAFRNVDLMNMSQALLHGLNENGFPAVVYTETPAMLRMCIDLIFAPNPDDDNGKVKSTQNDNSIDKSDRSDDTDHVGFFYTNDIKMLVDLALRELRNIPYESSLLQDASFDSFQVALLEEVRYMYLELLEAVISHTTWKAQGNRYLESELVEVLNDASSMDNDRNKAYSIALGNNYFASSNAAI